jgi:uncharacterized protein (TIGR02001 family)
MKLIQKKLLASAVALSALASVAVVPAANAELAATVSAANMYYWRGLDLGKGDPALIGDVNYTINGFYAGLWASSGDALGGTEYDFYAGYKFSTDMFFADLNYTTYLYPSRSGQLDPDLDPGLPANFGFNDIADVAVTLGLTPAEGTTIKLMHRIGISDLGDVDYTYSTLSGTFSSFTILVGTHSDDPTVDQVLDGYVPYDGLTHLDLSYAYNSKLSFTLGKVVDQGEFDLYNDELKFVVTLSLPIE